MEFYATCLSVSRLAVMLLSGVEFREPRVVGCRPVTLALFIFCHDQEMYRTGAFELDR